MEKGQALSANSESEVIEVIGEQEAVGWATSWGVGEDNPVVEKETEAEVQLV